MGGEPTSRPELPSFLEAVARAGAVCGVATSGRMLVYPKLRRLLLAGRVAYLRVALHGAAAETHDRIAGVPGAFEQTFSGLGQMIGQ